MARDAPPMGRLPRHGDDLPCGRAGACVRACVRVACDGEVCQSCVSRLHIFCGRGITKVRCRFTALASRYLFFSLFFSSKEYFLLYFVILYFLFYIFLFLFHFFPSFPCLLLSHDDDYLPSNLEPHVDEARARYTAWTTKLGEIESTEGSLLEFARSYKRYGLLPVEGGIQFREVKGAGIRVLFRFIALDYVYLIIYFLVLFSSLSFYYLVSSRFILFFRSSSI